MIHPDIELRFLSPEKGYGLFAVRRIPKGTVTFVQDPLDISIPASSPLLKDDRVAHLIERYSYMNARAECIVSWDHGKYMNHCCHANTLTTGYGFEIAIRDIEVGEEVTDDYGIFTVGHSMTIQCDKSNCRGRVCIEDFDRCLTGWDAKVRSALEHFKSAAQPLVSLIEASVLEQVLGYLEGREDYVSVAVQKVGDLESVSGIPLLNQLANGREGVPLPEEVPLNHHMA